MVRHGQVKNGDYAAFEIKLSDGSIKEGLDSLTTFYNNVEKKPKFMCVIVGHCQSIMCDPKTNIYVVPITSLAP